MNASIDHTGFVKPEEGTVRDDPAEKSLFSDLKEVVLYYVQFCCVKGI